jgi:hypothetical protein
MFLNQYVRDKRFRSMTVNVSESGIYLNRVASDNLLAPVTNRGLIGLEFELPETGETIWAAGEVRYQAVDKYFHGTGIRFKAMPKVHARLIRDYCVEQRRHKLSTLLARIRNPQAAPAAV